MKKLVTISPLPAQQQKFPQDNTATLAKTSLSWILSNTFSSSGFFFFVCGLWEKNQTKQNTTTQFNVPLLQSIQIHTLVLSN